MPDYENMTPKELEKENKKLMAEKAAIRVEQLEINRILTERQVEIEAKAKVESMTDKQREAMKQELSNVGGIKSEEKVESPGAE